jgi:phosphatidylserine decarboxylase
MPENLSAVGERFLPDPCDNRSRAAAIVSDFARHPGPKHGLVVGAEPQSPVLTAAIDALAPTTPSRWSPAAPTEDVRAQIRLSGAWGSSGCGRWRPWPTRTPPTR